MSKKALLAAAAILALPAAANAQSSWFSPSAPAYPGFYIGAEGGLNWLLNNNSYVMDTGWAVGGKVGYDFVGPRIELEGMYHSNTGNGVVAFPSGGFARVNGRIEQVSVMANLLYDFFPGATITPYVGAGAGIAFVDFDHPGLQHVQHPVRLSGHRRSRLQRHAGAPHRAGRPLLRHHQPRRLHQQQHHGAAERDLQVRPARDGSAAGAAAGSRHAAVLHGVLRLGSLEHLATRR